MVACQLLTELCCDPMCCGTLVHIPTSGPEVGDEDGSGSDEDEESHHAKKRRLGHGLM